MSSGSSKLNASKQIIPKTWLMLIIELSKDDIYRPANSQFTALESYYHARFTLILSALEGKNIDILNS